MDQYKTSLKLTNTKPTNKLTDEYKTGIKWTKLSPA